MASTIPEQISAVSKANVDKMQQMLNATLTGTERFAELQFDFLRTLMEGSLDQAKAAMAVKNVSDLSSLQATLSKPTLEKMADYSRNLFTLSKQTNEQLHQLFAAEYAETYKHVSESLEKAAKNAPAGSDVAINAMKSAFETVNSAYREMTQAALKMSEAAEAHIETAASAVNAPGSKKTTRKTSGN